MRAASGGALVAEVGFHFIAGDRLHPAAFQVVIAAVEHRARLGKLIEVAFDHILDQFVGGLASALRGEVLELLFGLGGEVDFHEFQGTEKPGLGQGKWCYIKGRVLRLLRNPRCPKVRDRGHPGFIGGGQGIAMVVESFQ